MSNLARILCLALSFLCLPALAEEVPELANFDEWTTYYYLHPNPDEVASALKTIDAKGYFNNQDVQAPLSGFFSEVFRANPTRVENWVSPYQGRPGLHILYSALWTSNTPQSKGALERLADAAPPEVAKQLRILLASEPPDIASTDVNSPAVLDYFWGSFMASGAAAPVLRIIDQMKFANTKGNIGVLMIGGSAQWSVAANARQHKRVREIVKSAIPTADPVTRKMLRDILKESQPKGNLRDR
jgi:hypothetical protein